MTTQANNEAQLAAYDPKPTESQKRNAAWLSRDARNPNDPYYRSLPGAYFDSSSGWMQVVGF